MFQFRRGFSVYCNLFGEVVIAFGLFRFNSVVDFLSIATNFSS